MSNEEPDLIAIFTEYVKLHEDFQALEYLPTLYHKVEVYPFMKYDSVDIYVSARTFEKISEDEKTFTFGTHLWGFHVGHMKWDKSTVEQTKERIDKGLAKLKKDVVDNAYYPNRKIILWAREERLKSSVSRWVYHEQ